MRIASITPTIGGGYTVKTYIFHADTVLKPKTARSTCKLRLANSSAKRKKLPGGITPSAFQLLTADAPMPTKAAVAAVPPRASTMASTESSMPFDSSPLVKVSSIHPQIMADSPRVGSNRGMDSKEDIGRRLEIWQIAEGLRRGKRLSGAQISRDLPEISESFWSDCKSGNKRIGLDLADQLCDKYKITLDFIYRGDDYGLPAELKDLLAAAEQKAAKKVA